MKSALSWKFMRWIGIVCNLLVILLIGVGFLGCATDKQKRSELDVFAAMSLTNALTEIGEQFSAKNNVRVYYNFAASLILQRQIEKGASADIFISASPIQVDALETLGLLEDRSRSDILANRLVLVSHKNSALSVETVDKLCDAAVSRIAIGQPEIVPAGTYVKEALIHFDLWNKLQPKLIFGTDVRATLAYVSTGNVDLAVVYETDTTVSNEVKVLYRFPADVHTSIVYPAVVLKDSDQKHLAQQFIAYLKKHRATEIFEKHGFTCLSSTSAQQSAPDTLQ